MKTAEDWWKERGGRVELEHFQTNPAVVDVEAIRAIQRDALAELKAANERLREALDRFMPYALKEYERCYPGEAYEKDGYQAREVADALALLKDEK